MNFEMENVTEVKCTLTRDSVCMGDDIEAPHQLQIHLIKYQDSEQFLNEILNKYSFPAMACWSCYLNDELFAIIKFDHKKEGVHAEYKYLKHKIEVLKVNFIHFKYDSSCTTWS